jgi:hypothetical protein
MRIRDRLIALATVSLNQRRPQRPSPQPPGSASPLAAGSPLERPIHSNQGSAKVPPEALTPVASEAEPRSAASASTAYPELPRELSEQMLQSLLSSRQRLQLSAEALAIIAAGIACAEATLRVPTTRAAARPSAGAEGAADLLGAAFVAALQAANSFGPDGAYLLSSHHGAPFGSDGRCDGSATPGDIIIIPGPPPGLAVSAAALTCAAIAPRSIDVLPALGRARTASVGDARIRAACFEDLERAAAQLAYLQSKVTLALIVLSDAIEFAEATVTSRTVDQEPADHVAQLAGTFAAIEAARSLAERTLAIFPSVDAMNHS